MEHGFGQCVHFSPLEGGLWLPVIIVKLRRENPFQRIAPQGHIFGMLEPCDGKLSRTVLRGERGGNAPDLPGICDL
jgi:hypothetical protein